MHYFISMLDSLRITSSEMKAEAKTK